MDFVEIKKLNKRIILFGAVENERIKMMQDSGIFICKILDNDKLKSGKRIYGIQIESADILSQEDYKDDLFIVMPERHTDEIKDQLIENGISNIIIAVKDIKEFSDPLYIAKNRGFLDEPLLPRILNVELSGVCNLKCVYCPFHGDLNIKKDKGLMSWPTLEGVVKQLRKIKTIDTLSVVGAGEVFLNPKWCEMSEYIIGNLGIKHFYLYTNGMLLNEENVKKIGMISEKDGIDVHLEVSVDGTTPKESEEFRVGSTYEKIKKNVVFAKNKLSEKNVKMTIFNLIPADKDELEGTNYWIDQNNDPPEYLKNDYPGISIISRKPNLDYRLKGDVSGFERVKIQKKEPYPICWNVFERMAINYKGALLRCSCGGAGIVEIAKPNEDYLYTWQTDKQMQMARDNILKKCDEPDFCYGCELKGKDPYYVLVKK